MKGYNTIMKAFWLTIAIVTCIGAFYKTWQEGLARGYIFFIPSLVALGMFFLRKRLGDKRKKEKES